MSASFPTLLRLLAALTLAMTAGPSFAAQEGAMGDRVAPWIDAALHWTTRGIEIAGIAAIVTGGLAATAVYLRTVLRDGPSSGSFHDYRSSLGRSILLGLEFLVAADIISTVAIDPSLQSVAVLAGVVLVRTFLSFALEIEIEGTLPWRKADR